ncbi:MAG: hypothetical protein ACPLYD_13395 [Anaerolineae bacterium]|jgi:hypothetical protein|uniref:hypothetical protein n=1 Tax=Thermogutta sp. TaxID=1962930 RepID=UPI00321FF40B
MLYARAITLRNCGRFTVVASDFGSDYRTHTHVTSEALYASLTRGATWRPRLIDLKDDPADFTLAYDVAAMPIWFLPGIFVADGSPRLPDAALDTAAFNVVHEFYPSTSKAYVFKKGALEEKKNRPYHVPTYGTIQAVKPDQRLITYAFSPRRALLEAFAEGQTFILGKKRTMFQIVGLSAVVEGMQKRGECTTGWLELPPNYGGHFQSFEVVAATMRYIILRGTTRGEVSYVEFIFPGGSLCLPDFYLALVPIDEVAVHRQRISG